MYRNSEFQQFSVGPKLAHDTQFSPGHDRFLFDLYIHGDRLTRLENYKTNADLHKSKDNIVII